MTHIRWFTDSPDAGDPACLCSRCGDPIPEHDVPLRAWKEQLGRTLEARFCEECSHHVLQELE